MTTDDDNFSLDEFVEHLGPEDGPRAHERHLALKALTTPAPAAPSLEERIDALAKRKHGKPPLRRR
jgi:hypothetical protein